MGDTPNAAMLLGGGEMGAPPPSAPAPMPNNLPPELTSMPPANVQPQASPGVTTQQGASSADTQPQQPPSGITPATDPEMVAAAHHHGRIGRALDAVSRALGGSQTMHVVEQPDGSFIAQELPSTPGERWGRIAKAALSGAAAGFANGQGPGGGARAFAAGAQTGLEMPQQMQDQTTKKAKDLEAQREQQVMFKKNSALADVQLTKTKLELMRMGIDYDHKDQEYADTRRKNIEEQHGQLLAHYKNLDDLNNHVQANQQLMAAHVGDTGTLDHIDRYEGGKLVGVDLYGIPKNVLTALNEKQERVVTQVLDPTLKKLVPKEDVYEPFSNPMSKIQEYRKTADLASDTARKNLWTLQNQQETADAAKQNAATTAGTAPSIRAKNFAEAEAASAKAKLDKAGGKLTASDKVVDANGLPLLLDERGQARTLGSIQGQPEMYSKEAEKVYSDKITKATSMDAANSWARNFALQKGNNVIADQAALQMLSKAMVGMQQGQGRGGNPSTAQIQEFLHSRSLPEDKTALFNKVFTGQTLTQSQRNELYQTVHSARLSLYDAAADEGRSQGRKDLSRALPTDMQKLTTGTGESSGYGNNGQRFYDVNQQRLTHPVPADAQTVIDKDGKVLGYSKNGQIVFDAKGNPV